MPISFYQRVQKLKVIRFQGNANDSYLYLKTRKVDVYACVNLVLILNTEYVYSGKSLQQGGGGAHSLVKNAGAACALCSDP